MLDCRSGNLARQLHHMSVMQTEPYQLLSSKFQDTIMSHATEAPQEPTAEAHASANSFCDHVAAVATDIGRQQTSQMLLLIMYHQLFDIGPVSMALSHNLDRCATFPQAVRICLACPNAFIVSVLLELLLHVNQCSAGSSVTIMRHVMQAATSSTLISILAI